MEIFNILGPIFLLIALGGALQRAGFFDTGFLSGANKLTYWVGLPALIFISLMKADHADVSMGRLLLTLVLATLLSSGLAWLTARAIGVKQGVEGTWAQAAFRGNLTFVGLPLILTTPGLPVTAAILTLAPLLVIYNGLSVSLLLLSRHRGAEGIGRMLAKEIARNPIIVASLAGGAAYLLDLTLWLPIHRSIDLISGMAVPLALICIGGALVLTPLRGNRRLAVYAAIFKTAVSPLIGYGAGRLAGLGQGELKVVLILMACPTAAASYTMVRELGGDENVAASSIVMSTLLSMASLSIILAAM
ncbi:MAG: AEC family transporter [Opitutaceae bacterium]|nr:AEC family transporter [Opitutaceae bacterium]